MDVDFKQQLNKDYVFKYRSINSVNGKTCGKSGGSPKNIKLAPGEIITKITYGQYPFGNSKCLCNLVFHTSNGKKHGPYGHANARSSKYDGEFSA